MTDLSKRAYFGLYGDETTIKAWCEDCQGHTFVVNGELQCCGTLLDKAPEIKGVKRESEHQPHPQRVYPKAKCAKCGKEFPKTRAWKRYCGPQCQWDAWAEANPRVKRTSP